ncbi:MAG TPA: hypothetical protein PKM36_11635 [Propionibacteriaceae bacterium]|nr:hypothetical protein [Propionibacteriaceae bacterium]HPZ50945.1 hypothetical protein [Propionibacteriaceae bacterium]
MFIGAEDLNAQIRGNVPGAELLPFIEAACDAVVQACGPIEEDDITERVRTGSGVGVLRYPAQSVTSGATLLDGPAGLVEGVSGDVTYKVGYATPPGWAKTAAVIIAEHLWQTRRGAGAAGRRAVDMSPVAGIGYLVPNQAAALMQPHLLPARP